MQLGVDRQAENFIGAGNDDRQSDNDPMVAAGGGDSLGGRGHGVAKPAQAVNVFASLVQQRVIDDQVEPASRIQMRDRRDANLVSQFANRPGGSTEEVIKTVERMPFFPRDGRIGLDGLEDAVFGSSAETHDPSDQNLDVGLKRRLGKSGQQGLQKRIERGYAGKHGRGPPCRS